MLGGEEVWAAWIGYRNDATEILARRFDGARRGGLERTTPEPGGHYMLKIARDVTGRVWGVYSANVKGNWDLYAQRFSDNSWSAPERLSDAPQSDLFQAVTTDSDGLPAPQAHVGAARLGKTLDGVGRFEATWAIPGNRAMLPGHASDLQRIPHRPKV